MTNREQLRSLLIVGAGGSGREIAWLARDVHGLSLELTFAVERQFYRERLIDGTRVVPLDEVPANITHYVVAVGDPNLRKRLASVCEAAGLKPATLVHPGVLTSERVTIGLGSLICAGTILTTNIRIGCHVHINLACTISHDAIIGDFVTISPGVHVSGNVHVEDGVFIGTGASTINGSGDHPLVIGKNSIVAAGACVTRNVESNVLVAGVPAVRKR